MQMMKLKNIILSIFIIGFGIVLSNWIYGNILEKKVDNYLKYSPKIQHQLQGFSYETLKVNPIMGSILLTNVSVQNACSFRADEITIFLKHKEAREIARTKQINQLSFCKLEAVNLHCTQDDKEVFLEKAEVNFNGWIDANDVKATQSREQDIQITFANLRGDLVHWVNFMDDIHWNNEEDIIKNCTLDLTILPLKNTLRINNWQLNSTFINIKGGGLLVNRESLLTRLNVEFASFDFIMNSNKGIQYGDENTSGIYSVKQFDYKMNGRFYFNEQGKILNDSSVASIEVEAEDLNIVFDDETKRLYANRLAFIGIALEECRINNLIINTYLQNGKWYINNTNLLSPLLSADVNGIVSYNYANPEQSKIDSSNILIHNVQPQLKGSIEGVERMFGLHIPRSGDSLVLQLKGSLKQPLVKGIHYN